MGNLNWKTQEFTEEKLDEHAKPFLELFDRIQYEKEKDEERVARIFSE